MAAAPEGGFVKTNNLKSVWNIRIPEPTAGLSVSHLRHPPSWAQFLSEIEDEWGRFMRNHDSPQQRLATKISARFVLH